MLQYDQYFQWMKKAHKLFPVCLCLSVKTNICNMKWIPLNFGNVHCLQAFWSCLDFELHFVAIVQGFVPITNNRLVMDEHVFAICTRNKSKTLSSIEPFDCSFFHGTNPFLKKLPRSTVGSVYTANTDSCEKHQRTLVPIGGCSMTASYTCDAKLCSSKDYRSGFPHSNVFGNSHKEASTLYRYLACI